MSIQIINRQKKIKLDLRSIRPRFLCILRAMELKLADHELNVLLVDDEDIRKMNCRYLQKNTPTNVLSFSMAEGDFGGINQNLLGDIVISVETAQRDGDSENLLLEEELDYLFIHGVLHLLGYDHVKSKSEAKKMKYKEREIFLKVNGFTIS